ncbi:MAG: acyl-CoA dehydrogenase family protein, partial [Caulobacteraceae bacterium]
ASAEVVFEDAEAFLLGEEGRGIATIIEMAALTRLDNVVSSAGIQRQAIAQAIHHARHRCAFGRPLADQPLMAEVLADLAIEVEAATVLAFRLVRAHEAEATQVDIALRRLATPAAKFYVCKRGPILAGEALEVLGGNGYIEESIMPRLYRELPVNSIWEGSGNVMALDVLRALRREPACLEALEAELCAAKGADARLDAAIGRLLAMASGELAQSDLRRFSEAVSLALQGALLVGGAPSAVAEAFCASRLDGAPGRVFGASAIGSRASEIIERAAPTN